MNLTVLEEMVEMLKNSSTAQLLLDLEPVKACMADPTVSIKDILISCIFTNWPNLDIMMVISLQSSSQASDCTGTYGGSSALPTVLASKCDSTTCDTITSDLDVVKECFKGKFCTILFDSRQIWNSSKGVLKMSFFSQNQVYLFHRSICDRLHGNLFCDGRDNAAVGARRQMHNDNV